MAKAILNTTAVVLVSVSTALAATLLSYQADNWNPEMKALLRQPATWLAPGWSQRLAVAPPPGLEDTLREIDALMALKGERAPHAENIALEDRFLGDRYYRFLGIEAYTHPRTVRLIDGIIDEAAIVVMHFKDRFNRARPWEYAPALQPVIPPPGHPAYPSGHATQAHAVSLVLATVIPESADALYRLADEIARNREIGGVHYASDSAAGEQLAQQLVVELLQSPEFQAMVHAARAEWVTECDHCGPGRQTGGPATAIEP